MTRVEQIAHLLATFRFDRVRLAMTILDWHWRRRDGVGYLPTIEQLRATARELLETVDNNTKCSSGGFEAGCDDGMLWLRFVLEEEVCERSE